MTETVLAGGDDIARSIEATLLREARRNELIIAQVRVALLSLLVVVELIFMMDPTGIDFVWRLPTFIGFAVAIGLFLALRNGFFHPALPMLAPVLDAGIILARMQASWSYHSLEVLQDGMELATVLGACMILTLTGAFRLRRRALASAVGLAFFTYLWLAMQSNLYGGQILTHLALLGGVSGMALGLTVQVRRAVRAEVGRMTLARFLPPTVIDGAHEDPLSLLTKPRSVEATVLVTDIRGFTTWSEQRDPIEVLTFLNVIQGALAEIVRSNHGTVDKFMGDGMLAVFGAPEHLENHAKRALTAARQMQEALARINAENTDADVRIGIGVHSGELVVGCLGSGVRLEFTILGDTVNTASRLESMTKAQGVSTLVSDDTASQLGGDHTMNEVGEVPIRGRVAPLRVWTLDESAT